MRSCIGHLIRGSVCGILITIFSMGQASATNDNALVLILTRAFLAENFTMYCAQFNQDLLSITIGKEGSLSELVRHVRTEVTNGLPAEEAGAIVRRSADAARAGALLAIRRFYILAPGNEPFAITTWCNQTFPLNVTEFIQEHDGNHDAFNAKIASAKEEE